MEIEDSRRETREKERENWNVNMKLHFCCIYLYIRTRVHTLFIDLDSRLTLIFFLAGWFIVTRSEGSHTQRCKLFVYSLHSSEKSSRDWKSLTSTQFLLWNHGGGSGRCCHTARDYFLSNFNLFLWSHFNLQILSSFSCYWGQQGHKFTFKWIIIACETKSLKKFLVFDTICEAQHMKHLNSLVRNSSFLMRLKANERRSKYLGSVFGDVRCLFVAHLK